MSTPIRAREATDVKRRPYTRRPAIGRLLAKVEPEPNSGCWLWIGARKPSGYGNFGMGKRKHIGAHVAAYRFFKGEVGPGLCVRHQCDNPTCVNPAHLSLGTAKNNSEDAMGRGRVARGERVGGSRLTAANAEAIRQIYAEGAITQRELATRFGISQSGVSQLISGLTWREIAS